MKSLFLSLALLLLASHADAGCQNDGYMTRDCPKDVEDIHFKADKCERYYSNNSQGEKPDKYMLAELDAHQCSMLACDFKKLQSKYRNDPLVSKALDNDFKSQAVEGSYWASLTCNDAASMSAAIDPSACHYDKDNAAERMPNCPDDLKAVIAKEASCRDAQQANQTKTEKKLHCDALACPRQEAFGRHAGDRMATNALVIALDDIVWDDENPWWNQDCRKKKAKP